MIMPAFTVKKEKKATQNSIFGIYVTNRTVFQLNPIMFIQYQEVDHKL